VGRYSLGGYTSEWPFIAASDDKEEEWSNLWNENWEGKLKS
jgi:hypothetical protein